MLRQFHCETATAWPVRLRSLVATAGLLLCILPTGGCSPYEWRHENQWESRDQIWLSEASQVKVRAAQSRVFETTDRIKAIQAVVSTCQDLGFAVEVLDESLGIVSAKKFDDYEPSSLHDASYHLYRDDGLLILTRQFRSWGPFYHRSNLIRLTVTVRPRGDRQLVVRASAQYYLKAVESPEPYQQFFRTLEQALFVQAQMVQ
ncbi:MAG: hypothetical protein JSR62_01220 [Nitrospira sp.]|nr:hypothetical protein [Nitrospira sp.]